MEIKRIFNIKFIGVIAVILLINCVMFYKTQLDNDKLWKAENGYSYIEYSQYYNYCIDRLRAQDNSRWEHELSTFYAEYKEKVNRRLVIDVVKQVRQQADYVNSYRSNIEKSIKQAENKVDMNIYDSSSYGYHNLLKSRYDFKKLTNIDVNISSNIAYDRVFDYELAKYFLLLLMILTMLKFKIDENGFKTIVRVTKKGRAFLNAQRAGIIVGSGICYTFFIYIPIIIISLFLYRGTQSLGDLVQSNTLYRFSMMIMPYWKYILLFILLQAVGAMIAGLIAWVFFSVVRERASSVFILSLFLFVEFLLTMTNSNNFIIKFFRLANIFTLLDFNQLLGTYDNWGVGSFIISSLHLEVIIIILLCITVGSFVLIYNSCERIDSGIKVCGFFERIGIFVRGKMAYLPNWIKECNKIIFIQKGYIFLCIIAVFVCMKDFGVRGILDDVQIELLEYYETVQGDAYEATDSYVAEINDWLDDAYESLVQYEELNDSVAKEELSKLIDIKERTLTEISLQSGRVKELRANGIKAGIVNIYNYSNRYGVRMQSYYEEFVFMTLLGIIFMFSGIFNMERENKMTNIIRITSGGRLKYLRTRISAGIIITGIITVVVNVVQLIKVNDIFAIKEHEMSYAIQSIPVLENFPLKLSIVQFEILLVVYRTIIIIALLLVIMFISMVMKKVSAILLSLLMVIPHILCSIGINLFENFSVVEYIVGVSFYTEKGTWWTICIFSILVIVAAALSIVGLNKRWNG